MSNRTSLHGGAVLGAQEVWITCGPNGSGKTTLLRQFLETGRVPVAEQNLNSEATEASARQASAHQGKPTQSTPPYAHLSRANSEHGKDWARAHASEVSAYVDPLPVSRDLTLQEHAHMVAASWLGSTQAATETAEQTLEAFRIAHLKNRLPHQVSLGQSQLFNLALAFARPASVIVLDEPERHLDAEHTAMLASIIQDRASQGTAFLIATHDPAISALADNMIEL